MPEEARRAEISFHPSSELIAEGGATVERRAAGGSEAAVPLLTVLETRVILGFADVVVAIDNQPDASVVASKQFTVEIPEGTTDIVPSLRGDMALFGRILSQEDNTFTFRVQDHHLGVLHMNVSVVEIGRVLATLEVQMYLRDNGGDKPWAGVVHASLLYLGSAQPTPPIQ